MTWALRAAIVVMYGGLAVFYLVSGSLTVGAAWGIGALMWAAAFGFAVAEHTQRRR